MTEITKDQILKAELFDLQVELAHIKQMMDIKVKELNDRRSNALLPSNVKEETIDPDNA